MWNAVGGDFGRRVIGLADYDGKLIAGGSFTEVDGVPAAHIAQLDVTTPVEVGTIGNIKARFRKQ